MNTTLSRHTLRKEMRQRRRQLTAQQQAAAGQAAAARILAWQPVQKAQQIAVYLSFDGELDTRPLINALWTAGKQVYLPCLHPFSRGNLLFLRYQPTTRLLRHPWKMDQPALDVRTVLPLTQLDILITPLVAFDEQGQRLGMGGGFYDRTLQHWRKGKLLPIGYAHDCQRVTQLAVEHWDVPLPAVVTPSRLWQW